MRTRCARIDLALPISSRRIWVGHLLAVLLAGAIVLGGSVGVLLLHARLLGGRLRALSLDIDLAATALPAAAGLVLAAVLLSSYRPGQWRVGGWRYWSYLLATVLAVAALLTLLGGRTWMATALPLLVAAGAGLVTYRALPATVTLVPDEAEPGGPRPRPRPVAAVAGSHHRPAPLSLPRLLFGTLHHAPPWGALTPWMMYGFVVLMGFILAGGLAGWIEVDELRFLYLPLGTYTLFSTIGMLSFHLFRLDPLPVSRRLLFALLTVPTMAAFALGYAVGRLAVVASEPAPALDYRIDEPSRWVEVDPAFMGFSWNGAVPMLASPWGESHRAWSQPLVKGGPLLLYSPFNTVEESSAAFEALMASRAVETIYGVSIAPEEIADRYFEVDGERLVGLVPGGFTLVADHPELVAPARGPEAAMYLILVVGSWLLLLALFLRTFRADAGIKTLKAVYWTVLGVLMGVMLAQVVAALFGWYSPDAARGLLEIVIGRLGGSPVSRAATWAVTVAASGGALLLAQRQFVRSELPASPIKCTLIDFQAVDD